MIISYFMIILVKCFFIPVSMEETRLIVKRSWMCLCYIGGCMIISEYMREKSGIELICVGLMGYTLS
jgi:hypothetical protein